MQLMTISAFAGLSRLSPKALRLYDRLGLLTPAHVDPANGYRFYTSDQVDRARLVATLRRLGMPLAGIADVLARPPREAADAIGRYWAEAEAVTAERRALAGYLQAKLTGADMTTYDIQTRTIPQRTIISISRHLHAAETDAFFDDAFARLRAAAPGIAGIAGCPFVIFYGDVSDDSDGPLELCRPVAAVSADPTRADPVSATGDVQHRTEPAHDEAYIRLTLKEANWPQMAPAADALEGWTREHGRQPSGALRQVFIADSRTAGPDAPICDLTVPLR
jgi:DNA-binding transcriptional MerR regulator